ncbi:hypothetical protein LY85_2242 [Clostridium sp. KNHs216]|nr:hypothetical protein LY85_2242 [Clostridium sp. KNHs216]
MKYCTKIRFLKGGAALKQKDLPKSIEMFFYFIGVILLGYGASLRKIYPSELYLAPIIALLTFNVSTIYSIIKECRKWHCFAWKSGSLANDVRFLFGMFILYFAITFTVHLLFYQ